MEAQHPRADLVRLQRRLNPYSSVCDGKVREGCPGVWGAELAPVFVRADGPDDAPDPEEGVRCSSLQLDASIGFLRKKRQKVLQIDQKREARPSSGLGEVSLGMLTVKGARHAS